MGSAAKGFSKLGLDSVIKGAKNSPGGSRTPNISKQYGDTLYGLENVFLPYEELVSQGRIRDGSNQFGLAPGQSRFGKDLSAFIGQLEGADPVLASYRQTVMSGLEDMQDGLPADFRRSLTEEVRSSQASRGIIDSDTAAIEEASRLMGGSEYIRATRLAEVQNYLAGVTSIGVNALMPGIGQMLQGSMNTYDMNMRRKAGIDQIRAGYVNQGIEGAGALIGMGMGGGAGGA